MYEQEKQLGEFFSQGEMFILLASITGTFEVCLQENNLFFRY